MSFYTKSKNGGVYHIAGIGHDSRCPQMNRSGYTGYWNTFFSEMTLARLMEKLNKGVYPVCKHCRKAAENTLYAELMPVAELATALLRMVNGNVAKVQEQIEELLGHAKTERNRVAVRYYTDLLEHLDK